MLNERFSSAIKDRYPTYSAFARELGWPRQKVNKILYGRSPKVSEINAIGSALQLPIAEVVSFFSDESHQKDDQNSCVAPQ